MFRYGDAARIFARKHILHAVRKFHIHLADDFFVLYDIHADIRVNETEYGIIYVHNVFYFDNVFFP